MTFEIRTERRSTTNGLDGTVYVIEGAEGALAEIWPALGCNCFRWQAPVQGRVIDLLYAAPNLFDDTRPTRSGIPILFPFPNRIRDGSFSWAGKEYDLPKNDSIQQNAIHGFACRKPWRIVNQEKTDGFASLTAEFTGAKDSPETRDLWPADYLLRIKFVLEARKLKLEIHIENPDRVSLPFGLGLHPYFRTPLGPEGKEEECWVEVPASRFWELADGLPTGAKLPVDASRDLTKLRRLSELKLDDVLIADRTSDEIPVRGRIRQAPAGIELSMRASAAFREIVVFTPPHRQAFCIEPYTCTTDVVNLQERGLDAGLIVLEPGKTWNGVVEMAVSR